MANGLGQQMQIWRSNQISYIDKYNVRYLKAFAPDPKFQIDLW